MICFLGIFISVLLRRNSQLQDCGFSPCLLPLIKLILDSWFVPIFRNKAHLESLTHQYKKLAILNMFLICNIYHWNKSISCEANKKKKRTTKQNTTTPIRSADHSQPLYRPPKKQMSQCWPASREIFSSSFWIWSWPARTTTTNCQHLIRNQTVTNYT